MRVQNSPPPGVMDCRPDLAAAIGALRDTLMANRRISQRLIELMRLRVAFRNQCRPCMSIRYENAIEEGVTEEIVCSLERPQDAPGLSAREKAAVAYADRFAYDHLAIDAERDALAKHFTAEEIAEIALFAAYFVAFGRIGAVFDGGEALPVGFRKENGEQLAPWRVAEPMLRRR